MSRTVTLEKSFACLDCGKAQRDPRSLKIKIGQVIGINSITVVRAGKLCDKCLMRRLRQWVVGPGKAYG